MKKIWCVVFVLVLLTLGQSEVIAEDTTINDDVFDLSETQSKIDEMGVPTVEIVAAMGVAADELYTNKEYEKAAPAYAAYAKNANWLANLIASGLEPYYGADYSTRKEWYPVILRTSDLAKAEDKSNELKSERNKAMLREGLCYYYLDDKTKALPLIIKALDLIDIKDEENWKQGMEILYSILGYK